MGRWEPNARERLVRAALDLFSEQGYDKTTVVEIAERAGLTKSTLFRHFPDKREVLFAGQDILSGLLADGLASAPASATPLEAVASGLEAASAAFPPERRDFGPTLRAVIAGNRELRERHALKLAGLTSTMAEALGRRGVPEPTASLAATVGILAFSTAYVRWSDPANQHGYAEVARQALGELRAALTVLDRHPDRVRT